MKSKLIFVILFSIFAISLSVQTARSDSIERLSAIATGGIPWDTKPDGIYNYLADREALAIIDISDSTYPVLTFRTTGTLMWSVGVDILDNLVYVNSFSDLWIGRVYPPDSIHFISLTDLPEYGGTEPWGIEAVDTILFFADGSEGLYILNVKNPQNPTIIAFYNTPGSLTHFFILDTLIYCADGDSMIILNIANPASPQYVGAVDIPRTCTDVYVVYPYAYATCYAYGFGSGDDGCVKIIDVSTPSNPIIVGSVDGIRGVPRAVFVNDDYIYVAARDWYPPKKKGEGRAVVEGGVRVAQGPVPDSLIISYDTPGNPNEIFVRGNLLLVPDSDSLQILYHHKVGIEEERKKKIPVISRFFVFPNPMSNIVTCKLEFRKSCYLSLNVYDRIGREVREIYRGSIVAGRTIFNWDGKDGAGNKVSKGTYFVRAEVSKPTFQRSEKIIYLGGKK